MVNGAMMGWVIACCLIIKPAMIRCRLIRKTMINFQTISCPIINRMIINTIIINTMIISPLFIRHLTSYPHASTRCRRPRAAIGSLVPQAFMNDTQVVGIIAKRQAHVGARELVQVLAQPLVPKRYLH
jgi:hypothetical protein